MFGDKAKTYEVDINADPHEIIDWDGPAWDQPDNVRELLRAHNLDRAAPTPSVRQTKSGKFTALDRWGQSMGAFKDKAKAEAVSLSAMDNGEGLGNLLYTRLGGNPYYPHLDDGSASQKLLAAGVKGGRYKNASGDENMVVFDPTLINILKKY